MSVNQGGLVGSSILGDDDPTESNFDDILTSQQLLTLLITSTPIQKQCKWLNEQALACGWEFSDADTNFEGLKYGETFQFETFMDWLHWSGIYEEILKSMVWSSVFANAIVCFYGPNDKPQLMQDKTEFYPELTENATKAMAFYPFMNGNGFRVSKVDKFGLPEIYELNYTRRDAFYTDDAVDTQTLTYHVSAKRVIEFNTISLEMGYSGTSKLQTTGHLARVQRQMLRSVFNQMKNLAAGVVACRVHGTDEKETMKASLESFSHIKKLYYTGDKDLEDIVKVIVPDMKPDQLEKVNIMLQKQIAGASNLSIRVLGEEDIATGMGEGSANFSHTIMVNEIKAIQRHYQKSIEHCFHLMGKENTSLVWNEPFPQEEMAEQQVEDDKEDQANLKPGEKPAVEDQPLLEKKKPLGKVKA